MGTSAAIKAPENRVLTRHPWSARHQAHDFEVFAKLLHPFKPAVKVKRLLYLTPSFVQNHRDLCAELAQVLQLQDCDTIAKLNPARARQLVVLRSDAADETFDQVRMVFSGLTEAVEHWIFCSEDRSRSRSGIAASASRF